MLEQLVWNQILEPGVYVLLYAALFIVAKWVKDLFTSYSLNKQLTRQDNLAVALTMAGYYLGVAAVFVGAFSGPSYGFIKDVTLVGAYSLLGIAFLNLSRFVNDRVILPRFSVREQLIDKHNIAVGAVQFGVYLATGLVAGGAVTGTGGGVVTALAFFVLGQLSLLLFTRLYEYTTPYRIHESLEEGNIAVGVALGGTLVALGIIVTNGVALDFTGWGENLLSLLKANVFAFVLLPALRFGMDKLVIPGDELSREVMEDKNIGAGVLEAVVAISFALVLNMVL